MRVFLIFIVLALIVTSSSLQMGRKMQPGLLLDSLQAGIQIATNPARREGAFYKNDMIKVSLPDDVTFKSYCNTYFCRLRKLAHITESQFSSSVKVLSTLHSDSKSGQQFWKSDNGLVVLKTLPKHESKTMREIIDPYTAHLLDPTQLSCLSVVLGMYSVSVRGKMTYFIACNNVFTPEAAHHVVDLYDVKGSTVGRQASPGSKVKKDLDALTQMRQSESCILKLPPAHLDTLINTIERDIKFLQSFNLMDYSLLICIEAPFFQPSGELTERREIATTPKQHTNAGYFPRGKLVLGGGASPTEYHMGIVDFLQKYTARKHMETIGKGLWYKTALISSVAPKFYAERFLRFIKLLGGRSNETMSAGDTRASSFSSGDETNVEGTDVAKDVSEGVTADQGVLK